LVFLNHRTVFMGWKRALSPWDFSRRIHRWICNEPRNTVIHRAPLVRWLGPCFRKGSPKHGCAGEHGRLWVFSERNWIPSDEISVNIFRYQTIFDLATSVDFVTKSSVFPRLYQVKLAHKVRSDIILLEKINHIELFIMWFPHGERPTISLLTLFWKTAMHTKYMTVSIFNNDVVFVDFLWSRVCSFRSQVNSLDWRFSLSSALIDELLIWLDGKFAGFDPLDFEFQFQLLPQRIKNHTYVSWCFRHPCD
jgi:hypothetical protein